MIEWRPVGTLPYEVSSMGSVRRSAPGFGTWVGRPVRALLSANGYHYFRGPILKRGRSRKNVPIHQAVAAAFIGPCPGGHEVNHRNGVRTDNRVENLEYVPVSENRSHSGCNNGRAKINPEIVREMDRLYDLGLPQTKIAEHFGVSQITVSRVLRRALWAHVPASCDD